MKPDMAERRNGVLISAESGEAVAYALWKLQERGRMFVSPGDPLYEGIIIGIHSRDNDLVVNPIKGKQLTNVRASGTDEAVRLVPPIQVTLESAIEFIADDELVEITPKVDPHPQAPSRGTGPQASVTRRSVVSPRRSLTHSGGSWLRTHASAHAFNDRSETRSSNDPPCASRQRDRHGVAA
jgi:hypothetical protein